MQRHRIALPRGGVARGTRGTLSGRRERTGSARGAVEGDRSLEIENDLQGVFDGA